MLEIKKILFPTSCNENAKNAFKYALTMAKYFGASIDVLYVCKPNIDILVPSVMRFELLQEQKRNAEKMLHDWVKEFEVHNIPIHKEVELGFAKETIAIYANKREDIDLIAIGINDDHSFSKLFWGTIVSQTVESSTTPVLVIPRGINFQDIKNIAYIAPDVRDWHAVYPQVKQMAVHFGAKLYITHLPQAKYGVIEGEEHIVLADYASALHVFAYNTNLHLMVTMASTAPTSVRNTFQRMFRYTKAQKMALKATIPLLVLKKPV